MSTSEDVVNLQENLNKIISWSTKNNMILNSNKFVLVSHKYLSENLNVKLFQSLPFFDKFFTYETSKSSSISSSKCVRDLGVIIDDQLNWDYHITNIIKKARQLCGWICSLFYSRKADVMITLFNSLVRTKLEYCCEVWHSHLLKHIRGIEQI